MEISKLNNKIIIIKDSYKKTILDKLNKYKKLVNVKIITLSELKKKYCFDYNKEAIYYVCNKYSVIYDVAKIYIDNLYYINSVVDNDKVKFLYELKKDLLDKNLIHENKLFKSFLKNKDIVLYNLEYIDKFYLNIIDELKKTNNIEEYNDEYTFIKKKLYKANNQEDEIVFVATEICKLISKGININNIKLCNVNDEYVFLIKKIFKQFNIPVNLKSNDKINGTIIVSKFKELYDSNMENVFKDIEKYIKTPKDKEIYKQLINIVNEYRFVDDYLDVKDLIFNDIDNINLDSVKYKNAVSVIDYENISDDYVFLINFNEGVIPYNYKDEDYLNDSIKTKLNISTSYEQNNISGLIIQDFIKYSPNLILTYSTHNISSELYVSSAYNSDILDIEDIKIDYSFSNNYNKLKLVTLLDDNSKYGTINDDLINLNNKYNDLKYLEYDNKYKMIDKNKLYDYLNNKLTLSYSSVNDYYNCSFKYYLNYILKVNKFDDSFERVIGNIFHKILSLCFNDDFDFNSSWKNEIKTSDYLFNNADKFFLSKLKNELLLIIDTIKNQLNYTQLSKIICEKEVIININENLNITFKGIIDKIMYNKIDGRFIVAIIDYKTGTPSLNLNNVKYGLDMQLPIYIYLVKNMKEFDNDSIIGGFYLQHLLSKSNSEDEKINNLKLQGYSNSDTSILSLVDKNYEDSNMIKSMKTTSNGFYHYAKIISNTEIMDLYNTVNDKINEASENIINAKFDINPKSINKKIVGCNYCKYKDICYMSNNDIINLEEGESKDE